MGMPKELKQVQRLNVERARLLRQAEQLQVRVQKLIDAANVIGACAEQDLVAYLRTLPPGQQAAAKAVPELERFFITEANVDGR